MFGDLSDIKSEEYKDQFETTENCKATDETLEVRTAKKRQRLLVSKDL